MHGGDHFLLTSLKRDVKIPKCVVSTLRFSRSEFSSLGSEFSKNQPRLKNSKVPMEQKLSVCWWGSKWSDVITPPSWIAEVTEHQEENITKGAQDRSSYFRHV